MNVNGQSNGVPQDTRTFMNTIIKHIVNGEILEERQLTSQLFTSFIFVGIFTHLFFSNIYSSYGTYGPASSLIWGYTIILFSMISLIFLNQTNDSINNVNLKNIKVNDIVLIVFIIWLISLNSKFSTKINSRRVPSNFYNYSWWTTILVGIELFIFIIGMTISNNISKLSNGIKNITNNITFMSTLILILIFMLIIIQQIILDNFSVDIL